MNSPRVYSKYNTLQKCGNQFTLETYHKIIRWKKNSKVLDLGCGDGDTTSSILEPRLPSDYLKLVGCDLQEKMVNYARESNKKPKLQFIQFDIAAETVLPEKFDHIFSFFAFHWVADLRKACTNVYEMLNPGGDMLVNFVVKDPYYNYLKNLVEHPVWSPYISKNMIPPVVSGIRPEEVLQTYLVSSGFCNCKVEVIEREHIYVNWEECLKAHLSLDPVISKLDKEEALEYLVDYFTMLKDAYSGCEQANGNIRNVYNLLVAYASKPE